LGLLWREYAMNNNDKKRKQSPVQLTLEGAKLPKLSPFLLDSQGNEFSA